MNYSKEERFSAIEIWNNTILQLKAHRYARTHHKVVLVYFDYLKPHDHHYRKISEYVSNHIKCDITLFRSEKGSDKNGAHDIFIAHSPKIFELKIPISNEKYKIYSHEYSGAPLSEDELYEQMQEARDILGKNSLSELVKKYR